MSLSKSGIPYLGYVWNPVVGCRMGCPYCWCGPLLKRIGANIGCDLCKRNEPHVHPERLDIPGGKPKVIGLGFMTDLFAPVNAPWTFLPPNVHELRRAFGVHQIWSSDEVLEMVVMKIAGHPEHTFVTPTKFPEGIPADLDPPDNWWLLVTGCYQGEVDAWLPVALASWPPGRVVLNLEPLCGAVQWRKRDPADGLMDTGLSPLRLPKPAGIIVGGMSRQPGGMEPLPMHPDWVRSLRDECAAAGVPFALRQWGAYEPVTHKGPGADWTSFWTFEDGDLFVMPGGHTYPATHPSSMQVDKGTEHMRLVPKVRDWPELDGRTHRALPWEVTP